MSDIDVAMTDGRTRWRYASIRLSENELQATLTAYGNLGWELASMQPDQTNRTPANCFVIVLKMPYWLEQTEEQIDE